MNGILTVIREYPLEFVFDSEDFWLTDTRYGVMRKCNDKNIMVLQPPFNVNAVEPVDADACWVEKNTSTDRGGYRIMRGSNHYFSII